jgi:pimeloyl-ACP methyl ester carboxylesterase
MPLSLTPSSLSLFFAAGVRGDGCAIDLELNSEGGSGGSTSVCSDQHLRLTVPTVSLMGGADAGVRPGMLDVYGDQADDLAGHIIDGAAHFLADDRPDALVTHALTLVRPCPLTDPRAGRRILAVNVTAGVRSV